MRSKLGSCRAVLVCLSVGAASLGVSSGVVAGPASAASTVSTTGTWPGVGKICGSGSGGGSTARGVSSKSIDIATFSDPGNTVQPGLNVEFFQAAGAFAKWCNAAGGINGRTVVVHDRDAALFNAAQVTNQACQQDFMSVEGGMALDQPSVSGVFPNLTVRENLWVMTHSGANRKEVEARAYERFPRLSQRRDQPAGTLSGGEQQMLAMARAVATRPRLLLLDELSMGLAPIVVDELYTHVAQLAGDGVTVVVVEQFARTALTVATAGVVMSGGRIVHAGPSSEVEGVLHSAYLGRSGPTGEQPVNSA